ncbi:MAG: hypothetical protein R2714_02795 [Microthrixaceae bacterium]
MNSPELAAATDTDGSAMPESGSNNNPSAATSVADATAEPTARRFDPTEAADLDRPIDVVLMAPYPRLSRASLAAAST